MMINGYISVCFLGAFFATFLLVPLVMIFARRVGAVELGDYRKINNQATPLLGGIAIAVPFVLISIIVFMGVVHAPLISHDLLILIVGSIAIVIVGIVDDTVGMRARTKLLSQLLIATFVCATSFELTQVSIPFFGQVVLGRILGGVVSVVWIVGLINAFNLIDGVDGLAAGLALIASIALAVLSALSGNVFIAYLFMVFVGSLCAFLLFNFNPARIFLGDAGSMFIGYVIAVLTLMGTYKSETAVIVFAPLLVLALPIFETVVSMLRRYVRGVPIFASDSRHTHHRLLNRGYSQRKVVLLLYSVAIMLGVWAVLSRVLPSNLLWVPILLFILTLGWISWLAGYVCFDGLSKVFHRRRHNVILVALARYATLSIGAYYKEGRSYTLLLDMCRQELRLSYLKVSMYTDEVLFESGCVDGVDDKYPSDCFCLSAATGERLVIYCSYNHKPNDQERHDIVACLANIFSSARLGDTVGELVA